MPKIDRAFLQTFREDAAKVLAELGARHGITVSLGNASFERDGGAATFKLELAAPTADGEMLDRPARDFKKYASQFGLDPEDLGREFTLRGTKYRVAGFKIANRRYPVIAERVRDGAGYKMDIRTVREALA